MGNYHFAVVVEKDKQGYFAYCPELQGSPHKDALRKDDTEEACVLLCSCPSMARTC